MEEVLRLYRSPYVASLPKPERTERYQSLAVLMAQFDYQFNRAVAKEEEWRASGAMHEGAHRKEQPDDDYGGEYPVLLLPLELDTG